MSLLSVPQIPFPPVFTPSSNTPTPLTGIRQNPCATPLWGGPSGHLADPTPNTGYEPKFCIDVRTSTYLDIPEPQAAACIRQQAQFPLCCKLEVQWGQTPGDWLRITILLQVGLASRKLVRTWIVQQLLQFFFESVSRENRDRDQNVVQTFIERHTKNLDKIL